MTNTKSAIAGTYSNRRERGFHAFVLFQASTTHNNHQRLQYLTKSSFPRRKHKDMHACANNILSLAFRRHPSSCPQSQSNPHIVNSPQFSPIRTRVEEIEDERKHTCAQNLSLSEFSNSSSILPTNATRYSESPPLLGILSSGSINGLAADWRACNASVYP